MTVAWVSIAVLLVGLPLAAVWWSRRAVWSRLRPGREADPLGDIAREHGLGPAARARVEAAVWRGTALEDPRERAAVVQLARAAQPPAPRRGVLVLLLTAYGCLLVAGAAVITAQGGWDDVPWWSLLWWSLLGLLPAWWTGRATRRAIQRNSD